MEVLHLRRTFKSNIGVIKRTTKELVAKRPGTLEVFEFFMIKKSLLNREGIFTYGVGVAVAVAGAEVEVAAGAPLVLVAADPPPTTITTYTSSPKNCPLAVDMRQFPRSVPDVLGAVIGTEISYCAPAGTEEGRVKVELPIGSPPVRANLKPASQAHEPEFSTFQVLVKVFPGVIGVLSGMDTSLTKLRP